MKKVPGPAAVVVLALLFSSMCSCSTADSILSFDQKRLQQIGASMNPSAKVCGNFYQYACDNWDGHENIKRLEDTVQSETSEMLEQLYRASEPKFLRQMYNYYVSYMDVENTEPLQYLKWLSVYENFKWPLLMESKSSSTGKWGDMTWIELLAMLRKFGFNDIFLQEEIVQRRDDPFRGAIELKRPPLAALYDFEQQVYVLRDIVDEQSVETLANFQMELLTLTLELVQTEEGDEFNYMLHDIKNPTNVEAGLVSLRDLQMPWLNKYLRVLLGQNEVDPSLQLYVQSVKYLQSIYDFVSKFDNSLVCDYIQLKFLIFLMEDDRIHYKTEVAKSMKDNFPLALQWIHGRRHSELRHAVPVIKRLFSNLKGKFKSTLMAKAQNLSAVFKEYLLNKLDKLELLIFDKSTEEMDLYYEHLNLLSSEYYGNRLRLQRFKFKVQHSTLTKVYPRNAMQYLDFRPSIEGHKKDYPYHLPLLYPRLNIIFMPLTMLQDPFYQHGMDQTYTYSSLGYLLAHEITKSFDSRYLQIDANGIYRSSINDEILSKSEESEEEQQTKNPAIDDLAGLKLAYDTFAEFHPDILLQTVTLRKTNFTMEKVFFMNYAHNFCSTFCSYHPMADFHSYDACARVNTPVRHSVTFRRVFGCSALSDEDQAEYSLWPTKK